MGAERALRIGALLALAWLAACAGARPPVSESLRAAPPKDALAVSDALEALIAEGKDTPADREYAFEIVQTSDADTAADAFARAAVTGRLVQQRGLLGASLVGDVERSAMRSRELDPGFRGGAATRLLGTLFVIAPASLLSHGDSEAGLTLLEGLVREHPGVLENHLRLAEAYVTLGDPDPAVAHLCVCLEGRASLRPDDRQLLDQLVDNVDTSSCRPGA